MEKTRGHFTLHFTGYSMYPFLKPGDRLIVSKRLPCSIQVGDIIVAPDHKGQYRVHRLIKMIPPDKGLLKGDSLLQPDPKPVELSTLCGKVIAILRKDRLIPVSTGPRSRLKKLYAFLSLKGLTSGALRLKAKNMFIRLFSLGKSNGHHKEWRFIIAILVNRSCQKASNYDWIKIKEVASKEGVIGILYKHLRDRKIPESILASFKDYYLSVAAQNTINLNALEKLEDALNSEKIEVMTLKGASLFNTIYHDIGMRPMGDLDLMVRQKERNRLINLLNNLGYKEDPLLSHFLKKDRIVIDLHIHALNIDRIANRSRLFPAGMEPVWANSVPWGEGYRWLRRPDDIDNVLLLSQHFMKHSFSKLIWLVDILKLIRNNDVMFLTDLLKRADYLRQRKSLSFTLYLMNRIFYCKLKTQNLSRLERGILEARANGQSIDLLGPLMAISCVNGFTKKIAFGLENLFPINEILKQEASGAFSGNKILYYLRRFWNILATYLRRFYMILGHLIRG